MSADTDEDSVRGDEVNPFRELREYARGALDVDHRDVHRLAGLVEDERTRHVLEFFADAYDPSEEEVREGDLPRDFWETEFGQKAVKKFATDTATKAIREGNLTQASYITGLPSYKSDVSGLHAINQLADWLVHSEQCKLIYLAALMGRGKTDLSLTMMEVVDDHYRRLRRSVGSEIEVPEPEFGANFHVEAKGDTDVKEIHHERDLLEWAEQGSSDEERWFIFDEASTELTAQSGANAQKVAEKMAPFVKKMRKMGINMIVIGHDKGDVHVAIRSLADFVDKAGLKTASFYAGIKKREPVGHLFDLAGIPQTEWTFDTDDTADWKWISDEEEEIEDEGMDDEEFKREVSRRAGRVYNAIPDATLSDVADAISTDEVSISAKTVSRYSKKVEQPDNTAQAAVGD